MPDPTPKKTALALVATAFVIFLSWAIVAKANEERAAMAQSRMAHTCLSKLFFFIFSFFPIPLKFLYSADVWPHV